MGVNPENILDLTYVNRNGDSMSGPLLLNGEPQADAEATAKSYVDRVVANLTNLALLRDGSLPMVGPLTLAGLPTQANHATGRAYVDTADALRLLLTGGTLTGPLTLPGAPTVPLHAANMGYVDAADVILAAAIALRVPLDGSVAMTGPLVLPGLPTLPLHAATKGYVDAIPPGQTTYDAIIDAGGGADYTDIVTACATEPNGSRMYVNPGTYNETASIVMLDEQQLIGGNRETTIIDFGDANRKLDQHAAAVNNYVSGFTIAGSRADYTVDLGAQQSRIENCRIIGTVNANGGILCGTWAIVRDCQVYGFTKPGTFGITVTNNGNIFDCIITGNQGGIYSGNFCNIFANQLTTITQTQVSAGIYTQVYGNSLYGISIIMVRGAHVGIITNFIRGDINWSSDHDFTVIANNHIYLSEVRCNQGNTHSCSINGNTFSGGDGVDWAGHGSSISGNAFEGTAHIQFQATARENVASGNNLIGSTKALATRITDLGLRGNQAFGNQGVPVTQEKYFSEMLNTSGGLLVDGDCVVLKSVANGHEFDTTVNIGDDKVLGMVNEPTIANNNPGQIQTRGFTDMLKVNGVINIGVGDLLGTFNAAGIAQQAQAGDMAFAIALEAYAGADSLGVIDALLITPRKV